ncbi:MAG: hypothetical protein IH845_04205 [Nanoarchaeota archaeon]|nr:hypothetical protein [Nanoarchaeota archaeon]
MSSEREVLISRLPFIKRFVFEAIKVSINHKIKINEKETIDTSLVPKISQEVMHASMNQKTIPGVPRKIEPIKKPITPRMHPIPIAPVIPKKLKQLVPPKPLIPIIPLIPLKPIFPNQKSPRRIPPRSFPPRPQAPRTNPLKPKINEITKHIEGYGKINAFLEDPSISSIECPGPAKPIIIVRIGQRQITRIVLSPEEIKEILDTVADETHIPLLEGVFRAAVDSFSISAVISEIIGSKFVIRKHTPYSMLEK